MMRKAHSDTFDDDLTGGATTASDDDIHSSTENVGVLLWQRQCVGIDPTELEGLFW
jgi:hypothetical protein